MLIEFSVENFRSICERQTFSMIAGTSAKRKKHVSFPTGNTLAPHALRAACIFGSNGAGKSNLVRATRTLQTIVSDSANETSFDLSYYFEPHLLAQEAEESPTELEIVFVHEGSLYQYGFSFDGDRICSEWLFEKPNKKGSTLKQIFSRDYEEETNEYEWCFPTSRLTGHKTVWQESTRPNALFLSTAVMLNSDFLKVPYDWISSHLRFIDNKTINSFEQYTSKRSLETDVKAKVLEFLTSAESKIEDIIIEEDEYDFDEKFDIFSRDFREEIKRRSKVHKDYTAYAIHQSREGRDVALPLQEESDGTRAIFALAVPWLDVLEFGLTLVVDELHNGLHPNALNFLVNMFLDPRVNTSGAQLIFTSHETSLLKGNFMHRDQIWLVEKDDNQSTETFPLSDFEDRNNPNIQKAYLEGRYGAVPKLGAFKHASK